MQQSKRGERKRGTGGGGDRNKKEPKGREEFPPATLRDSGFRSVPSGGSKLVPPCRRSTLGNGYENAIYDDLHAPAILHVTVPPCLVWDPIPLDHHDHWDAFVFRFPRTEHLPHANTPRPLVFLHYALLIRTSRE